MYVADHYFVLCRQPLNDDEWEYFPLMLASKGGHAKCVKLLLEKKAKVYCVKNKYNCLMESIERGHK